MWLLYNVYIFYFLISNPKPNSMHRGRGGERELRNLPVFLVLVDHAVADLHFVFWKTGSLLASLSREGFFFPGLVESLFLIISSRLRNLRYNLYYNNLLLCWIVLQDWILIFYFLCPNLWFFLIFMDILTVPTVNILVLSTTSICACQSFARICLLSRNSLVICDEVCVRYLFPRPDTAFLTIKV